MKDDILVEQTLAGDHQAFNSLITDHYADIYGMILSWVKNPEDAKDLTQDVFISAYLDLPSLRDHERLCSWLRQIARHKCQNWRRRQVNFVPLDNDLISKESSTDEVLILRETLAKVMEAIDKLQESEKILLKEHYLDGVSYDELKARHGVSAGTLATRLFRVRLKIRNQLEKTLSAFVAFLHSHTESILIGGVEIMKLSIKTKLIAGGIAVMLASGGTGVIIWDHQQSEKIVSEPIVITQEASGGSSIKMVSSKKNVSDNIKKRKDNQNKEKESENSPMLSIPPTPIADKSELKTVTYTGNHSQQEKVEGGYSAENDEKRCMAVMHGRGWYKPEDVPITYEPPPKNNPPPGVWIWKEVVKGEYAGTEKPAYIKERNKEIEVKLQEANAKGDYQEAFGLSKEFSELNKPYADYFTFQMDLNGIPKSWHQYFDDIFKSQSNAITNAIK
jgi:RNA polymerase sigma-70 factor, ECF subfamily